MKWLKMTCQTIDSQITQHEVGTREKAKPNSSTGYGFNDDENETETRKIAFLFFFLYNLQEMS